MSKEDSKHPAWKSEFSTNFQVEKKISTEESLKIIEDAHNNGITTSKGNRVAVPQGTTTDGTQISLKVRQEAEHEKNGTGQFNKNPFLQQGNANPFNQKKGPPPQKSLYE